MEHKQLKVCPKCGSTAIGTSQLTDKMGVASPMYMCKDCSYEAALFPEVNQEKVALFQKDIRKKSKKVKNTVTKP
ncbi:MAG TPA: hypothetical protein VJK03_00765 [Candidatus Nanoarchaeia archaeon]|nr:hypothetical protein [Candidatus Nanoarchaeia archaeon]